jgi:hypothetical protein
MRVLTLLAWELARLKRVQKTCNRATHHQPYADAGWQTDHAAPEAEPCVTGHRTCGTAAD